MEGVRDEGKRVGRNEGYSTGIRTRGVRQDEGSNTAQHHYRYNTQTHCTIQQRRHDLRVFLRGGGGTVAPGFHRREHCLGAERRRL